MKPGDIFKPRLHSRAFIPQEHGVQAYVVKEDEVLLYLGEDQTKGFIGGCFYKFLLPNLKVVELSPRDIAHMLEPMV